MKRLSAPSSGSARRRARERRQAQDTRLEGERLARQRRDQRQREKLDNQQLESMCPHVKAREQLASYEPWGRGGCGAMNPSGARYRDLRQRNIYPEDELKGINLSSIMHYTPSRKRGPIRLREDPQICFQDSDHMRKAVDVDIRYRLTPDQQKSYKQILDELVASKRKRMKAEKRRDLEYERLMQTVPTPWGRPGPGGRNWRNPRDIGLGFNKSMGWTDNQIFNGLKLEQRILKESGIKLPDINEQIKTPSPKLKENATTAPNKLPEIKTKPLSPCELEKTQVKTIPVENKEANEETRQTINFMNDKNCYDENSGKFIKRLSNGVTVKKLILQDNLRNESPKKPTPESNILRVTGGIELVPILARKRRVGARTLPSSDVTKPPEDNCEWRDSISVEYLRELKNQMKRNYEIKEIRKKESAEQCQRHQETWAAIWGRPGHGAPLRGRYSRSNLAQLLYQTEVC